MKLRSAAAGPPPLLPQQSRIQSRKKLCAVCCCCGVQGGTAGSARTMGVGLKHPVGPQRSSSETTNLSSTPPCRHSASKPQTALPLSATRRSLQHGEAALRRKTHSGLFGGEGLKDFISGVQQLLRGRRHLRSSLLTLGQTQLCQGASAERPLRGLRSPLLKQELQHRQPEFNAASLRACTTCTRSGAGTARARSGVVCVVAGGGVVVIQGCGPRRGGVAEHGCQSRVYVAGGDQLVPHDGSGDVYAALARSRRSRRRCCGGERHGQDFRREVGYLRLAPWERCEEVEEDFQMQRCKRTPAERRCCFTCNSRGEGQLGLRF